MAAIPSADRHDEASGPILRMEDFKRAGARFVEDAMTHHAAALTYYSLLSLFPALLFTVAVLGLIGQERLIDEAASYMREVGAPEVTVATVTDGLQSAISQRGSAIGALTISFTASVWGAAAAFGAAGTALNVVLRVQEGRGIVRRKLSDIASTMTVLGLVTLASLLVFLGGELASGVFGLLGLGDTAAQVWRLARWPGALACTLLVYAIVYHSAPDVARRSFKWISPGAIVGVALWMLLSGTFFLYVASIPRYSLVYGTFAAIVILLVWIWLTNVALLLGAELNAAIDLRRAAAAPQSSVSAAVPEEASDQTAAGASRAPRPPPASS